SPGAALLRLAHGGERIGSLTRLRDDDAQSPLVDDRISVPEFRRVFDLDRNSRQLLHHALRNQCRVPAGPAGGDDDVVDLEKLFVGHVETAELGSSVLEEQPAAHAVFDRLRLLEDLLQHEMVEATALDLAQVPVDLAHFLVALLRAKIDHAVAFASENGEFAVVEVDNLAGIVENRRRIARHEVLALAEPDEERASLSRRH